MENTRSSGRLVYLDLLRFFNIFFMMMTHIVSRCGWHYAGVETADWAVLNIYDSLVRFSVPVFVMISGVFFLDPKKELTGKSLFGKYILRIATAFVFWSFCYALAANLMQYRTLSGAFFRGFAVDFIGGRYHLWFLYMIAALYLVTPFLRRITEERRLTEYFLLLCIVFGMTVPLLRQVPLLDSLLGAIVDKMHLNLVLGYVGAYVSGYYFHTYGLPKKARVALYVLGGLAVVFTAAATQITSRAAGEPLDALYGNCLLTTWLTASAVFVAVCTWGKQHGFTEKAGQEWAGLSRISFGMYLVHDFFIVALTELAGIDALTFSPVLAVPLLTAAVFLLSAVASWLIGKIPVLNRYIL